LRWRRWWRSPQRHSTTVAETIKGRIEPHDDRIEPFFDSIGPEETCQLRPTMSVVGSILAEPNVCLHHRVVTGRRREPVRKVAPQFGQLLGRKRRSGLQPLAEAQ
jgi:hypothetical protein